MDAEQKKRRLLLINTCGDVAEVAVCDAEHVLASEKMERGRGSAEIVAAVRRTLGEAGCKLRDLEGVGVVSGPGSFTGMRTGLAAAKGLCESAGVPLAAVSRLEVLVDATGGEAVLAALDAGRGEVYVREPASRLEWVCTDAEARSYALRVGSELVAAEERLAERISGARLQPLDLGHALPAVLRRLAEGGDDGATLDANYVRGQDQLYRKMGAPQGDDARTPAVP